jgi:hypothetical protein
MASAAERNLCIFHTLDGLQDGLSHFAGPSRAALLYALGPDDPILVCDPQSLLRGHEPKFRELYLDSDRWRREAPSLRPATRFGQTVDLPNLHLAGLISYGSRSPAVFYQIWFTEQHPDMCSIGPTERWLEHAAWLLAHDLARNDSLCPEISGYVLRGYATHAVRDCILDEMNRTWGWDSRIRIYPVLDAVLGVSKTREEGAWPRGKLVVAEPGGLEGIPSMARFPARERPVLRNFKHVRKLLQAVEGSERRLVSDGTYVVGISGPQVPQWRISADFRGGYGFLKFNGETVCSFADGNFHASTHQANLVQVEEILIDADLPAGTAGDLYRVVARLVHRAEDQKYGCTLVIDLNSTPIAIAGQNLETPLDLRQEALLDLAGALAKVDGALHIGADQRLHGFACLLDGRRIPGEDRSRGARFNSALRFTAENRRIVVVVVSEDRPVAIIQDGVELSAQCELKPAPGSIPPPMRLEEWIAGGD